MVGGMKTFVANVLLLGLFWSPAVTTAFSGSFSLAALADKPLWFAFDEVGGMYGETESGYTFSQIPVHIDDSVRMQKFTMGTISYYISDRGVIDAPTDLMALSIYFSLG
jgi:hypothetical protein